MLIYLVEFKNIKSLEAVKNIAISYLLIFQWVKNIWTENFIRLLLERKRFIDFLIDFKGPGYTQ